MHFVIKECCLPHPGVIPGARWHKKIVIPEGETVYCIVYGMRFFWAVYLDKEQAEKAMQGLEDTVSGKARRKIDLPNLVAWNFKSEFPKRVVRPK